MSMGNKYPQLMWDYKAFLQWWKHGNISRPRKHWIAIIIWRQMKCSNMVRHHVINTISIAKCRCWHTSMPSERSHNCKEDKRERALTQLLGYNSVVKIWQPFILNASPKEGIHTYHGHIWFPDIKEVGPSNLKGQGQSWPLQLGGYFYNVLISLCM